MLSDDAVLLLDEMRGLVEEERKAGDSWNLSRARGDLIDALGKALKAEADGRVARRRAKRMRPWVFGVALCVVSAGALGEIGLAGLAFAVVVLAVGAVAGALHAGGVLS